MSWRSCSFESVGLTSSHIQLFVDEMGVGASQLKALDLGLGGTELVPLPVSLAGVMSSCTAQARP